MSQSKPNKFPVTCTKSQLYDMYAYQIPKATIKKSINEIIKEKRKLNITQSPRCHYILRHELEEFVATYGLPANYEM